MSCEGKDDCQEIDNITHRVGIVVYKIGLIASHAQYVSGMRIMLGYFFVVSHILGLQALDGWCDYHVGRIYFSGTGSSVREMYDKSQTQGGSG